MKLSRIKNFAKKSVLAVATTVPVIALANYFFQTRQYAKAVEASQANVQKIDEMIASQKLEENSAQIDAQPQENDFVSLGQDMSSQSTKFPKNQEEYDNFLNSASAEDIAKYNNALADAKESGNLSQDFLQSKGFNDQQAYESALSEAYKAGKSGDVSAQENFNNLYDGYQEDFFNQAANKLTVEDSPNEIITPPDASPEVDPIDGGDLIQPPDPEVPNIPEVPENISDPDLKSQIIDSFVGAKDLLIESFQHIADIVSQNPEVSFISVTAVGIVCAGLFIHSKRKDNSKDKNNDKKDYSIDMGGPLVGLREE